MSAGARVTVVRLAGRARPEAISAERPRSRDSATALSPRPTTVKATAPPAICTWTSTGRASTPSKATVDTRDTMSWPPAWARCSREHLQNIGESASGNLNHVLRRPRRRRRPDASHPALRVCDQSALRLIQDGEGIAERIADTRASANRDIERRLSGLPARVQEEREGLVNILNQNIGFWTNVHLNRSRTRAHRPIAISKGGSVASPPAFKKNAKASSTFSTRTSVSGPMFM